MKKTAASIIGLVAKTFTANTPVYSAFAQWDETECPESLLD